MMINANRIAEVMGLPNDQVKSLMDLEEAVEHGLPASALDNVALSLASEGPSRTEILNSLIPPASRSRYKEKLTADQSSKVERIARVFATAIFVLDDRDEARRFMTSHHPLLSNRTPFQAAMTDLGARRVEEMLWRVFYGIPV
jgi:putative toxin-antitoxin system antitoxin component (TIGR02293 family)